MHAYVLRLDILVGNRFTDNDGVTLNETFNCISAIAHYNVHINHERLKVLNIENS